MAAAAIAAAVASFVFAGRFGRSPNPAVVRTNILGPPGLQTSTRPADAAISPDGRMVAFTATQGRGRQVFVRFLNGGEPLPVTTDDADHQSPRWSPDGSSLVYFSPAGPGELQGTVNRIPTLGGPVQRVIASIGGADVGRNGRLGCFRLDNQQIQLVTAALDGSDLQVVANLETRYYLRFEVMDSPGVLGVIATALGKHQVSIEHMVQEGRSEDESAPVPVLIITHTCREGQLKRALASVADEAFMRSPPRFIRIEKV